MGSERLFRCDMRTKKETRIFIEYSELNKETMQYEKHEGQVHFKKFLEEVGNRGRILKAREEMILREKIAQIKEQKGDTIIEENKAVYQEDVHQLEIPTKREFAIRDYMTPVGYELLKRLTAQIKPVWNRPASSSGKYHQRGDGTIPTIREHTQEMLYAATKIIRLFGYKDISKDNDLFYIAIMLHDAFKYGLQPDRVEYTDKNHDNIVAEFIDNHSEEIAELFGGGGHVILSDMLRYHSGIWSPDLKKKKPKEARKIAFVFKETFFLHMLDMLSANNCLRGE
jgi:hypothetical protein